MSTFRPKKILEEAQHQEAEGNSRMAATHYATLGLYLRRKGKLRESRKLLVRAVQLHPSSARLYLHLAAVEGALGNTAASSAAMRAFLSTAAVRGRLKEYKKQVLELGQSYPSLVLAYYEKWLEHDRTEAKVFVAASHAAQECGEFDKALSFLREAFELSSKDKRVHAALRDLLEKRSDDAKLHALESYELGRLDREQLLAVLIPDAAVEAAAAHRENPPSWNASFTLDKSLSGMISALEQELEGEVERSKPDEAELGPLLREFKRGTEKVVAGDASARFDLAHAYSEMGLVQEALGELKQIPHDGPWHVRGVLKQAELLIGQGSYLGALECAQEVARLEAAGSEYRAEAIYQTALIYLHLGDFSQALQSLDILDREMPAYRDSRSLRIRVEEARRRWKHEQAG